MSQKGKYRPIIGILTGTKSGTATSSQPFGSRTAWIRQLVRAGSIKARCYAFTPQSINWSTRTVTAWSYSPTSGWHRRTAPLPDVVYNRLPSRGAEKSAAIAKLKANFASHRIPIFNWSFFEKSDIHQRLERSPSIQRYIPETIVSPDDAEIRRLLFNHKQVYLKPVFGSLGIGIYRLSYSQDDGYLARFRSKGRVRVMHWDRFSAMMRFIHRRSGRLYNHIAQQGIQLLEIDGGALDFRFHLNKNSQNRWVVAGIGAKRAAKGGVTTHIHSGGAVYSPIHALERVYSQEKAKTKLAEAKSVAINLAQSVEQNYPHLLGELGFDIGIDRSGKIWMFEVNSKPGRSIYKHPALRKDGRETLRQLLNYCVYLGRQRRLRRGV